MERDGIFLKGNIVTVIAINSFFAETFSFPWLSVENSISLQDNSDAPKRIKSKWRYGMDEKLNEIQSKTVSVPSMLQTK